MRRALLSILLFSSMALATADGAIKKSAVSGELRAGQVIFIPVANR